MGSVITEYDGGYLLPCMNQCHGGRVRQDPTDDENFFSNLVSREHKHSRTFEYG